MINNDHVTNTPTKSSSPASSSSSLLLTPSTPTSSSHNATSTTTPSSATSSSSTTPSSSLTPSTPSSSSGRMTTIVSSAPIIKRLPQQLQETLKSGTSITSLSDCLKELIENALDAQATNIEIQLQGKEGITIKDNGHGIHPDNFETLCKRYYTHKFNQFNTFNNNTDNTTNNNNTNNTNNNNTSSSNDDNNVNTEYDFNDSYYGYKGEALNSICNLSKQVHIKTKYGDDSELGTYLIYDSRGEIVSKTLIRMNRGTIITIQELFSSIPVHSNLDDYSEEVIDNQLNNSSILQQQQQASKLNNSSISNISNISGASASGSGSGNTSIITQSSPSINRSPSNNSNSGNNGHYTSTYRTPSPGQQSSRSLIPTSVHNTTPSTPSPPIFNKRSLIINNSGSSGGNSGGGWRSNSSSGGNSTSNYSTNHQQHGKKHIELDDSLLEAMDDLIGVPILPKNNDTTSNNSNSTTIDSNNNTSNNRSNNVNNNNMNLSDDEEEDKSNNTTTTSTLKQSFNNNSNSVNNNSNNPSLKTIVQPIDVNKFKSTTPNNSKKRKTIQTKLTIDSMSQQLHKNYKNIEIENINEELIFKKRKIYSTNEKKNLNFDNETIYKISKNDIFTNIEIIGELENKIGIIYHLKYNKIYYIDLNIIKSDCIYNNLMNTYSFKDSIIPLQQPINLLLCKNELSNRNLKSICVKPEYQNIFEMNGFKIEFEKLPLENEPTKKKITKLNLIGIINNNSFGTREHYNYGLQDFIELLQKIETFEKDLLENDVIKNILKEKKATRTELISLAAIQFRPNTMIEYFKNTAKYTSSSLAGTDRKSIHEILMDLKTTCFFKLHQFMSRHTDENFDEIINDITGYFHPMEASGSAADSSAPINGEVSIEELI